MGNTTHAIPESSSGIGLITLIQRSIMIFERGHFTHSRPINLNEAIRATRVFSNNKNVAQPKPTVFISHKHSDLQDAEEAKGIVQLFEDMGAQVYIDSMDNKMPSETSGETALRIKDVIKACKKFVLVATEKAIESYWCNWELGIGDTHKYIEHIAIVPIKERGEFDTQFKGNEYMQIYPSIDYEDGTTRYRTSRELVPKGYYVSQPVNREGIRYITPLVTWLKQ